MALFSCRLSRSATSFSADGRGSQLGSEARGKGEKTNLGFIEKLDGDSDCTG